MKLKIQLDFYNAYAIEAGFSTGKRKTHMQNGKVLDRVFVCSCEGTRGKHKRDDDYKSHRPETKCGCLAKLKINCRQMDKYHVVQFIAQHNHALSSPSKAHLFRSRRKMCLVQASKVDVTDR